MARVVIRQRESFKVENLYLDQSVFGKTYFVDSGSGASGNTGLDPLAPLATIAQAVVKATANQGDKVIVAEGHAESIATVGTISKAGVKIVGLGHGNTRPAITVTAVIDGFDLTAAEVELENLRFVTPSAAATALINIAARKCAVRKCLFELGANVVDAITVTADGEMPLFEDNEVVVTANGPDSWIKFEGVVDRPIVRGNIVIGSDGTNPFDDGVVDFDSVAVTNPMVYDNKFDGADQATTVLANVGGVTGDHFANNQYSGLATDGDTAGSLTVNLANDAITAAKIAANAIGASEIATGAIDADALATDAVAEIADGLTDEAVSGHVTSGTVGAMLQPLHSGAVQAAGAATVTLAAGASATNELYDGCLIQVISGTGAGQVRLITAYNGGTKVATVTPAWATQPVAADVYVILPHGSARVDALAADIITAASIAAGAIDAGAFAAGAIDATAIAAGAIDADALAADTIAAAKIAAGAITAAKFAAGAVDNTALGADALSNAKIADGALSEEQFDADAAARLILGMRVARPTEDVVTGVAVPIFTVAGGAVLVTSLVGEVTTQIGAGATNAKFQSNPTTGTTTNLCANLDIDGDEIGSLYTIAGAPGTAMQTGQSGSAPEMTVKGVVVAAGQIEFITDADRAGSIKFRLHYVPLDTGATVVAV